MADRKISDLTALTTPASGDYVPIVDISESAAASKNKRITIEELMRGMPDGTAAAPGIAFETDPNTGIYSPGADQLAVSTGGTGRLFVDSAGNVGIGTSSPAAALDILGNLLFSGANSQIQFNAGGPIIRLPSANTLAFLSDSTTERLRIDSSGNVGIGTSSPGSLLHLADAGDITVGTTTGTKIGTATTQKISLWNATPVVQPAAVANITTTATAGSLPTANGAVTIANAATPTVAELLEYCVELEAKLEDLLGKLRTVGIIAT